MNNENIEYYEVLTDGDFLWVQSDTLVKVCKTISYDQLSNFKFKLDRDVVYEEDYVMVEEAFLRFIKDNTYDPKYCPRLALLRTMTRQPNYETIIKVQKLKESLTNNNTYEYGYEKSR